MKISIFFISLMLAQNGFAKDQKAKEFILCKNTQEVRTLAVMSNDSHNCVAHYTKKGKDEIIAQAKTPGLCHDRVKQLQGILKSAKYNCRTIAKAQVMTSSEMGAKVTQ